MPQTRKTCCTLHRMLDVQRLRVLRAVVADGSIQGAANALGYSSSAISQQVTALQRATGLRLIQKNGRGIEPTAAAFRLANESEKVFEGLAELDSLVADMRVGNVGGLTVSYFSSAGTTWIPPVIAKMSQLFPRMRLDLRLSEIPDAKQSDVAIYSRGRSENAGDADSVVYPLVEEPYYVVVRRDSELASYDQVPLRVLEAHPWIDNDTARGPCRQVVIDACAAAGFTPTFRIEAQDFYCAIQFAVEGLGITVLPRLSLAALPTAVVAVPIVDPVPQRRIAVRIRSALVGNAAVDQLVQLLKDQAALSIP